VQIQKANSIKSKKDEEIPLSETGGRSRASDQGSKRKRMGGSPDLYRKVDLFRERGGAHKEENIYYGKFLVSVKKRSAGGRDVCHARTFGQRGKDELEPELLVHVGGPGGKRGCWESVVRQWGNLSQTTEEKKKKNIYKA